MKPLGPLVLSLVLLCPAWSEAEQRPSELGPVRPAPVDHYSPQRLVEAIQAGDDLVFLDVR